MNAYFPSSAFVADLTPATPEEIDAFRAEYPTRPSDGWPTTRERWNRVPGLTSPQRSATTEVVCQFDLSRDPRFVKIVAHPPDFLL